MNRRAPDRTTMKSTVTRTNRIGRHAIVLAASVLALSSSACGTVTNLTNVWRSPDFEAESMRRILVVAIASTPMRRRSFEDSFAKALAGQNVDATSSYHLLPSEDRLTEAELRGAVKGNKFDGVIVTRLMGVEEETIVVPPRTDVVPTAHRGYYGYYHRSYDVVHTPGYVQTREIVVLDTQLYDVGTTEPVWGARSETIDPQSVDKAIESVTSALSKRLAGDDLLPR
jgi:hypothetical protein